MNKQQPSFSPPKGLWVFVNAAPSAWYAFPSLFPQPPITSSYSTLTLSLNVSSFLASSSLGQVPYDPMLPWHPTLLHPKSIYVRNYLFSLPDHKGPRRVTVVLLGTVPGLYSCSITIYWMDEWMDGQDQLMS